MTQVGALPVFSDVDPVTCCLDAVAVEDAELRGAWRLLSCIGSGGRRVSLPQTEQAGDEILALPVDAWLTKRDMQRMASACNAFGLQRTWRTARARHLNEFGNWASYGV